MLTSISEILAANRGDSRCLATIDKFAAPHNITVRSIVDEESRKINKVLLRSNDADKTHFLNGVVLDGLGNVLCYPPKRLTRLTPAAYLERFGDGTVASAPSAYELIEAANGTLASIYYDGVWRISTGRSIDASQLVLMNGVMLRDAFEELLEMCGYSWDDFDQSCSYTFVLCHPAYHVILKYELHFIVVWDRDKKHFISMPERFVDTQQWARDYEPQHVHDICWGLDETQTQSMGFLLRSATPGVPDYYVESRIMTFLREHVYENYKQEWGIEYQYRKLYMLLHVYAASKRDPAMFGRLFGSTFEVEMEELEPHCARIQCQYEEYEESRGGNLRDEVPDEFYTLAAAARHAGYGAKSAMSLFRLELIGPLFKLVKLYIA